VTIEDTDGGGGITIEDRSGNHIKLDSGTNALAIKVSGDASIECDGSLTLKANGGITVNGGAGTVDVKGTLINLN